LLGQTLRSALVEQQQLTPLEVLSIGVEVAKGMAWAHVLQVIHRDLKPENVFLTETGEVKVLNTGITSFIVPSGMTTERDWVRGTLLYMSPEHVQGYGVTGRSDIYSLGTLLYECLAGKAPILIGEDKPNLEALTWRQISQMPPPLEELVPGVPSHLSRIIQQMLAKEAVLRFGTMDEVAIRLRESYDRLMAESGANDKAKLEQRPYIVFPSSALGMKAAAVPHEGPEEKDVVAGSARLVSAAAAAQREGHPERNQPTPSKPDVTTKKPGRRAWITAIALGALVGIAFALLRTGAFNREEASDPKKQPVASDQPSVVDSPGVASSLPGPSAVSPSERPTRAEASLGDAKNQNKPNTYGSVDAGTVSSRRSDARPVINAGKSGTRHPSAPSNSPASDRLVF
jgi:serine/threonine protein kinase